MELSLLCCDDDAMQVLNRDWRGKDRTTDVLSFPQLGPRAFEAPPEGAHWGDVVVCMPQAARQAARYGATLEDEVCRLLIHGVLHLLGHDHVHGGRQAGGTACRTPRSDPRRRPRSLRGTCGERRWDAAPPGARG